MNSRNWRPDNKIVPNDLERWNVYDQQRRRLRFAAFDADCQSTAKRNSGTAFDSGSPDRTQRPSRDPPDDVRRVDLRSPNRGWPRGGWISQDDQGSPGRTGSAVPGSLIPAADKPSGQNPRRNVDNFQGRSNGRTCLFFAAFAPATKAHTPQSKLTRLADQFEPCPIKISISLSSVVDRADMSPRFVPPIGLKHRRD